MAARCSLTSEVAVDGGSASHTEHPSELLRCDIDLMEPITKLHTSTGNATRKRTQEVVPNPELSSMQHHAIPREGVLILARELPHLGDRRPAGRRRSRRCS